MPKRATVIHLNEDEEEVLIRLTKRHRSEQHLVMRAQIILAAARGTSNAHIARDMGITVDTVRLWRDRWARWSDIEDGMGEQKQGTLVKRLQDAPRPGAIPKFTVEQRVQMAVLACEAPATMGRPISQWTAREIADALKEQGIVSQISPRHAARLLKRGSFNHTVFGIG